jgi:hypothetical protein
MQRPESWSLFIIFEEKQGDQSDCSAVNKGDFGGTDNRD